MKRKKVDFYLIYEHWQRELYGLILLKIELERRGYSVRIGCRAWRCETDPDRDEYEPKVVVYPWMYSNLDMQRALSFKGKVEHVVNMQSEQIMSEFTMEHFVKYAKDSAKMAYHVCWGKLTEQRFLNAGVSKDHLRLIGNINLDINRNQFSAIFDDRETKAKKYGLDINKKWIMYFSNFKIANGALSLKEDDWDSKKKKEQRVRQKTLEIFEQYIKDHKDVLIIYRPHPVEGATHDAFFTKLQQDYPEQFKVIADDVIQAWIKVCDIFLSYISTSLVDVKYVNKKYALLRPEPVDKYEDGDIYLNSSAVTSLRELEEFMDGKMMNESIPQEDFTYSISNNIDDIPVYKKLADWLEEIIRLPADLFGKVRYDDGASFKHRIKRNLLIESDGLTAKVVRRIRLKKYYKRVLQGEDMSEKDYLAKKYRTMPFSEYFERKNREYRLEQQLRAILNNK